MRDIFEYYEVIVKHITFHIMYCNTKLNFVVKNVNFSHPCTMHYAKLRFNIISMYKRIAVFLFRIILTSELNITQSF